MQSILGNTTRRPDISFYKSGRIDITATVAKALSLKRGDVVDIMLDDDEFLLFVRHKADQVVGKHEAQCFATNKFVRHCNNFRCYSTRLCNAMLSVCKVDDLAKLPAGEPRQLERYGTAVPIITRNVLSR